MHLVVIYLFITYNSLVYIAKYHPVLFKPCILYQILYIKPFL